MDIEEFKGMRKRGRAVAACVAAAAVCVCALAAACLTGCAQEGEGAQGDNSSAAKCEWASDPTGSDCERAQTSSGSSGQGFANEGASASGEGSAGAASSSQRSGSMAGGEASQSEGQVSQQADGEHVTTTGAEAGGNGSGYVSLFSPTNTAGADGHTHDPQPRYETRTELKDGTGIEYDYYDQTEVYDWICLYCWAHFDSEAEAGSHSASYQADYEATGDVVSRAHAKAGYSPNCYDVGWTHVSVPAEYVEITYCSGMYCSICGEEVW